MIDVKYEGRTGNNMIQYVAAKMFSRKNDIFLNTRPIAFENFGNYFKITENGSGGRYGGTPQVINDSNFQRILNMDAVPRSRYIFDGYFQDRRWLEPYREDILRMFEYDYIQDSGNKVFIHYRIGDIVGDWRMLPLSYYESAMNDLEFEGGYISSDSIDHPNCKHLIDKYGLIPYSNDPLSTIDFGSRQRNIVLSEGTFSWWMGFLNRGGKVITNERERKWHGDINMSYWNKRSWDVINGEWRDSSLIIP